MSTLAGTIDTKDLGEVEVYTNGSGTITHFKARGMVINQAEDLFYRLVDLVVRILEEENAI